MIRSYKELQFYIMADMMMTRGKFKWSAKDRLNHLIFPDYIMRYMRSLRWCSYIYRDTGRCDGDPELLDSPSVLMRIRGMYHRWRYRRLAYKLGYSIGWHSLGYGAVLSHFGTTVMGWFNRIGYYPVIHTSSCVGGRDKVIGDGFYLSVGAKVVGGTAFGDYVTAGANAVVTKSSDGNVLLAGIPARPVRAARPWYEDDPMYTERWRQVENLREQMNLD